MRRWLWRLRGLFFLAPVATRFAAACVVVFVVQLVSARVVFVDIYGYRFSYANALNTCFGLSGTLLGQGFFWQPVTYLFLHDSWWHLGFNMLTVLLFGAGVEAEVGGRRFATILFGGGVVAGLGWLAMSFVWPHLPGMADLTRWMPQAVRETLGAGVAHRGHDSGLLIGASGGVFALIGAYGALFPRRMVCLLLVFFPVRMRALTLVLLLVGLDLAATVFVQGRIASEAHVAGCLAGYLYGLWLRRCGVTDASADAEEEFYR